MNKDSAPPHPSLPARPPPSTYSAPPSRNPGARGYGGNAPAAYGGFTPRAVVAQAPVAHASAAPSPYSQPTVSAPYQPTAYPSSSAYYPAYPAYGSAMPAQPPMTTAHSSTYDPEKEAQIQEWNSAFTRDDANGRKGGSVASTRYEANTAPDAESGAAATGKQKTVVREGGGKKWEDASLLEWDPLHPRLFVGNLAGEVTDDSLLKAFSKYPSVSKARVVRDKKSTKSKSYGFVSFSDTDDYFRAAKEMNGKYIGSHPVLIKRAVSEIKAVTKRDDKHKKFGKNRNNNKNKTKNEQPEAGNAGAMPGVVPFVGSGVQKKSKGGGPRILG